MRVWPRSIRWQMLAGLVLLEALSIGLFALLLIGDQAREVHERVSRRLESQAVTLSMQVREALLQGRPEWIGLSARMMADAPSVATAKVTDPKGNVLYVGTGDAATTKLDSIERVQIPLKGESQSRVFLLGRERLESVSPIYTGGELRGYVWVEDDRTWDYQQLDTIARGTSLFAVIWILASVLLVLLASNAITRPLDILHRGTRALMNSPDAGGSFPLPVIVQNEFGDLIVAFNRMVASIEEQRAGLNDTLSLLDSMLANAPIGLIFFDRNCRIVRVNQVFAEMSGVPLSRHLGRTLAEVLPEPIAQELDLAVLRVFAAEESVRNLEIGGDGGQLKRPANWLVSAYPIRTTPSQVRWAGVIVMDESERKRSEDALRRSEKLAATGRLAASISHEINNPLEAITNLLFLLSNYCPLDGPALDYVKMAQHEARRISEITQQTLRFFRQSTLPARTNIGELLDSVLSLYQMRLNTLGIKVVRTYGEEIDLYCFAGEIRQVIANLVGNAIDATTGGGRLMVRARRSECWKAPRQEGVRITVADTGSGIEPDIRMRIFEAFFTTKDETGTGLGLWVSQEIIRKHHGLVHLRSRPASNGGASGTVFQLFFPDNQQLTANDHLPAGAEAGAEADAEASAESSAEAGAGV